ncbi:MAG: carboxylesterase/lipase family protein [Ktedonobacteraceae bacterium]
MGATSVVETQYGKLQGTQKDTVFVWKGIPFAQPPIGSLRFRAPQPPEAWTGVREATQFGAISHQPSNGSFGTLPGPMSEDCLTLNIWSPGVDDARRPVIVWIHGGSFVTGSGSTPWYNGTSFATHGDVVVVTLNYRLGALGFLYLAEYAGEAYATSGNNGLFDQIAALTWVRENIAAFGGDPNNVTLFGESAGAMSIGALLAMPAAHGLFKRAIMQSGAAHRVNSSQTAANGTQKFLQELELGPNDMQRLLTTPVDDIIRAQETLPSSVQWRAFSPVVDGVALPKRSIDAIADGSAAGVDVLIGTNLDEMKLFTVFDPKQQHVDTDLLTKLFGKRANEILATYEVQQHEAPLSTPWEAFLTDRTFRIPAIRVAEHQAKHGASAWMYRFDWPTPVYGGVLGACHALEIPFVFNTLQHQSAAILTGGGDAPQSIADAMHATWIAFAHGKDLTQQVHGLPTWPRYDEKQRATMLFNTECCVCNNPQAVTRQLWEGVM